MIVGCQIDGMLCGPSVICDTIKHD